MAARLLRPVVLLVCAAGIVGMIVASVRDAGDLALTFGLVTVAAVTCLMVATAVAASGGAGGDADREAEAAVEELAQRLIAGGADEALVRQLVEEASKRQRG